MKKMQKVLKTKHMSKIVSGPNDIKMWLAKEYKDCSLILFGWIIRI